MKTDAQLQRERYLMTEALADCVIWMEAERSQHDESCRCMMCLHTLPLAKAVLAEVCGDK